MLDKEIDVQRELRGGRVFNLRIDGIQRRNLAVGRTGVRFAASAFGAVTFLASLREQLRAARHIAFDILCDRGTGRATIRLAAVGHDTRRA